MQRLTPHGWFSVSCFTAGILLGSVAIGYLILTSSPVPFGATAIAFAVAFSPVCLMALLIARFAPAMSWLLPPSLLVGGFAVPLDFAFACLLGTISVQDLQLTIVGLVIVSTLCLRILLAPVMVNRYFKKSTVQSLMFSQRRAPGAALQ